MPPRQNSRNLATFDPIEGTSTGTARQYDQSLSSDDEEIYISNSEDEMAVECGDEIFLSGTGLHIIMFNIIDLKLLIDFLMNF